MRLGPHQGGNGQNELNKREKMAYNILFTSMYAAAKDEPLRYYTAKEGNRRLYTDAMLTVEATTKYILSCRHIDEILILGRQLSFDLGDETRPLDAGDGKMFYSSDINELSTYSLYRYRLAQYIDDLRIEQQDIMDLLTPEEQKETEAFLKAYFKKTDNGDPYRKFSKFFDMLSENNALYDGLKRDLKEAIPGAADRLGIYLQWIKNYLYMNLKDTNKMEILEGNETAKIRFVPTVVDDDGKMPVDSLLKLVNDIAAEHEQINIHIAFNNDDMTDNFVLLSVMDMLDAMYGGNVTVEMVCTSTNAHYKLAGTIRNDTEGYGMTALVSAERAFLKYGKVDMIVDYWEKSLSKNEQVEKMIYAMRRIDVGLSLCSITEIEKGIDDLRKLFRSGFDLSNSDYYSSLFMLMAEGIRKDYGRILTAEDAGLLDLIRWAFEKGYYQQCLTLIEARAPKDFISKGIYYYCNDENEKDSVTEQFAHARNALKGFDQWKMEDIDHYYIKVYFRFKHPSGTIEYQRENAREMVSYIDAPEEKMIRPYSACDDRQALEDLIFSYMHIGRIRNQTNHAEERAEDDGKLFHDDKDPSEKLVMIRESIQYFIQSYETVLEKISGKEPAVVRISSGEVKAAARRLDRDGQPADRHDKPYKPNKAQSEK